MYCPKCAQERTSPDKSFCTGCGYLLTGTAELLEAGGLIAANKSASPRSRGLKQGLFILLTSFLVVPFVVLISVSLRVGPFFVLITALSMIVGGLLRMAYAAMFESTVTGMPTLEEDVIGSARSLIGRNRKQSELPQYNHDISPVFIARPDRLDTNELQPVSVVEGTTKLLGPDDQYQ